MRPRTRSRRSPAHSLPASAPTLGALRYTLEHREGSLLQTFSDFYDLLDTAEGGTCDMTQRASRKVNQGAFNDASTFEQAIERARHGWPENTAHLRQMTASLTDAVMRQVSVTEFRRSEEDGIGVDLDSYVMGEPDCLLRPHEVTPPGQESVRIVLNACISWHVAPEVMQAKGAAVAALANALELAGRRTEIVVAAAVGAKVGSGHLETAFPAKRENEPIQLDQLAFSVASADVFRRLIFAAWETLPAPVRTKFGIFPGGGYGRVSELRHHRDANLVISSGANERVAWTDANAAREWVLRQLEAQGVMLAVAA